MYNAIEQLLAKALEAGVPNAAPGNLVQGAALQGEDLSNQLRNVCFQDKHIKLQKVLKVESCKSMLVQFDRQISYGSMHGKAVLEGHVGREDDGRYIRATVPMAFYAEVRKASLQSNLINTVDGVKGDDRQADNAIKTIAGAVELDCFRGYGDFSNAGVFDGSPSVLPKIAGMHGLDLQVRQSDGDYKSHDLMFAEFGSDESVVIPVGGTLTQVAIEDSWTRSNMNFGEAERLILDPISLSNYNKLGISKERIVLANSAQELQGTSLRKQATSGGMVSLEASRFLSGKTQPAAARLDSPANPTISGTPPASTTDANAVTSFLVNQVYIYAVSGENEVGESIKSPTQSVTIAATGDTVVVTITHVGTVTRFFNVYRTLAGGKAGTEKFIGRVVLRAGQSTTIFTDLNNKQPRSITGFLIQEDSMALKELSPYSRKKLAESELFSVEAHYRFVTLAVYDPRFNVLLDSVI